MAIQDDTTIRMVGTVETGDTLVLECYRLPLKTLAHASALNKALSAPYAIMSVQYKNPGATWLRRELQSSTGHAKVESPC